MGNLFYPQSDHKSDSYKIRFPHSLNDEPAVITSNCKMWYKNGKLHREGDKPAIEHKNGTRNWYKFGKLHREGDLPAVEFLYGTKMWYYNGELHREGDLPAVEYFDGTKEFWKYNNRYYV